MAARRSGIGWAVLSRGSAPLCALDLSVLTTLRPYDVPSFRPSVLPSFRPSVFPSFRPSVFPSFRLSVFPSFRPLRLCVFASLRLCVFLKVPLPNDSHVMPLVSGDDPGKRPHGDFLPARGAPPERRLGRQVGPQGQGRPADRLELVHQVPQASGRGA